MGAFVHWVPTVNSERKMAFQFVPTGSAMRMTATTVSCLLAGLLAVGLYKILRRRRLQEFSERNPETPGLQELLSACNQWEKLLSGLCCLSVAAVVHNCQFLLDIVFFFSYLHTACTDESRRRALRQLLRHAYSTLNDVYQIFENSPDSDARVHHPASQASSDSFLSVSSQGTGNPPVATSTPHDAALEVALQEPAAPSSLVVSHTLAVPLPPEDTAPSVPADPDPIVTLPPVVQPPDETLYETALQLALAGRIRCRNERLAVTGQASTAQFLACLHCLRAAFQVVFSHPTEREWFMTTGDAMMCRLLARCGRPHDKFRSAYRAIVDYVAAAITLDGGQVCN